MELEQKYFGMLAFSVMGVLVCYEWFTGKYKDGKKTTKDWQMFGLSAAGIQLIERPLLMYCVYLLLDSVLPAQRESWGWISEQYLALSVVVFILIDEFLHGFAHNFTHSRKPKSRWLARLQAFYLGAHRPHHMNGGRDGKGEISASHVTVAGWGWMLMLPNYWFGMACLYFGLVETWFIGTAIKSIWGIHVHTNWRYDLYLLNHPNRFISKTMYALCHIFTFPNQHHQHHSRSGNSTKNLNNFLALYDWLFWKKLVIANERPKIYGWIQRKKEADSAIYRYLHRSLKI